MKGVMVVCLLLSVAGVSCGGGANPPPPESLMELLMDFSGPPMRQMVTLACLKVMKERDLMKDLFHERFPDICDPKPPAPAKRENLVNLLRGLISRKKRDVDDNDIIKGCLPFVFGPPPEPKP